MRVGFLDCELDIARHELRRSGRAVALEPQVFDVLAYLVRNRERLVTKNELLDEVWGDRFVSESALTSRIKSVRRAVGDTGHDQRIIRTIHGRGYRFVAALHRAGDEATAADPRGVGAAVPAGGEPPGAVAGLNQDGLNQDAVAWLLDSLGAGRGGLLEVEGPHGSGKTALGDEAVDGATARGFLVGTGSAAGAAARPFACVIDAIDELAQRDPGLLGLLPGGPRGELDRCLAGVGPTTRQRLFVAARELVVQAAGRRPTFIALDDLELADDDTLALVRHIARLAHRHRVALLCLHRSHIRLGPGFRRLTLAATLGADRTGGALRSLPPEVADALARVALRGPTFDLLEFRATAGVDVARGDRLLDLAIVSGVIEPIVHGGYRFSDPDDAERLAHQLPPHRRAEVHRSAAQYLESSGAPPDRVAAHLLEIDPRAAVPAVLEAARRAAASERHGEVLRWTAAVIGHATRAEQVELLRLRGDALVAAGDPSAVHAYRNALSVADSDQVGGLRARLARAGMVSGDLATATEALEGLRPDGGRHDGEILMALGMHAYLTGDIASARQAVDAAREMALSPDAPNVLLDIIVLEGMIAHNRGEWFDRLLRELRATRDSPALASKIFDCHICVAEYLLYGPTPYTEVVTLARELRANAERTGARRAVAFAACVAGEAELLGGDLDAAQRDLREAVALHRELGAETGTAHSLQRLAEAQLAAGNPAEAERSAREALVLARWSPLSRHILQRAFGTLIAAAPDAAAAVALVDEARETLDAPGSCPFCEVMVAVPSSIACAEAGRLDEARQHLVAAELSAALWEGTAWQGSVAEAKACLARAEGDAAEADRLLDRAALLFDQAGQPLDAARCREAIGDPQG